MFKDPGLLERTVAEVMEGPLPVLDTRDTVDTAMGQLTGHDAAVLVCEGATPVGVLTRADLLEFMTTRKEA